jgi:hypothetical protein
MKGVLTMQMVRMLIQVPTPLIAKLDALRKQGPTASGFMRGLIEREFQQSNTAKKVR